MSEAEATGATGALAMVPVADIAMGERLRPVDPVWADMLGAMMAKDGQTTPITVCRTKNGGYRLVAGAHRTEGARMHGISALMALVIEADDAQRLMHEISENLFRRELDPLDRATFVAEMVALKKFEVSGLAAHEHGSVAAIRERWRRARAGERLGPAPKVSAKQLKSLSEDTSATVALVYGWAADVGEMVGLSRRAIYLDLALYSQLSPQVAEILRTAQHPILRNAKQLRALAGMGQQAQANVVSRLVAAKGGSIPAARTVAEAIAQIRDEHRDGETAEPGTSKAVRTTIYRLNAHSAEELRDVLQGLSPETKDAMLEWLADWAPPGWKLVRPRNPGAKS